MSINGHVVEIEQSGCLRMTSESLLRIPSAGGTIAIDIEAVAGCSWNLDSQSPALGWITPTSATAGSGSGRITFTVPANSSAFYTYGFLWLRWNDGQLGVVELVRDGAACGGGVSVPAPSMTLPASSGSGTIPVTAPAGCSWSPQNNASAFLTLTSPSTVVGNGTLQFTYTANDTQSPRQGVLGAGGRSVRVSQNACTAQPQLPTSIPAIGGSFDVPVTAPSCTWGASSPNEYVRIRSSSQPGQLSFDVYPNNLTTSREVSFNVNGQVYTTHQGGQAALETQYLSEGATGTFFSTRMAVLNPGADPVEGRLRFLRSDGTALTRAVSVPARRRMTVSPETVTGLEAADFSTVVESDEHGWSSIAR